MNKQSRMFANVFIENKINILIWLIFLCVNVISMNNLVFGSIAKQFLIMIFMTMGLSLEMICGDLDLAFAAQISSSTVIAAYFIRMGVQVWMACALVFAFNFLIGILKGFLLAQFEIPSIIMTWGLQIILSNLFDSVSNSSSIFFQSTKTYYNNTLFWVCICVTFLVLTSLLYILLKRTYYGRYCRMLGENRRAVQESGLNYVPILIILHVIAAAFFAVTAIIILLLTLSGSSSLGSNYLYKIIAAACLGGISFQNGRGEIRGMIIGTITMIMLVFLLTQFGILNTYENILEGFIIIISLLLVNRSKTSENTPTNSENGLIEGQNLKRYS